MPAFKIITTESSPYAVPTGKRVLQFNFVGDAGGGTVTITPGGGVASDPVALDEDEPLLLDLPLGGVPILGAGTSFAWTGIARYRLILV